MMEEEKNKSEIEDSLEHTGSTNIVMEFWEFLCENKKFWLIPILIILLLLGLLIFLGGTSASPFVYTLF